jgi:hypothetical protein
MKYEDLNKPSRWLFNQIEKNYIERTDVSVKEFIIILIILLKKWTPKKQIKERKLKWYM